MTGTYGPNTKQVEAFLALLPGLNGEQWIVARGQDKDSDYATWRVAFDAAVHAARGSDQEANWETALGAALDAATDATQYSPWVALDAAFALVVRDLIAPEHFDILTAPMRAAGIDFDALEEDE